MNYGFMEAFSQVLREKRLDKELLLESLQAGLTSAVKKKYGNNANVDVTIDDKKGGLALFLLLDVVPEGEVEDDSYQIAVGEAKEEDEDLEVGDVMRRELGIEEFGRNAIQTAKQVVLQRVREAERGKIFEEFSGRVGEIVSGKVQQVDRGDILINLGRAEALLPREEQIRSEHYHQGDTIRAYILRVEPVTKGPQITLSRRAPEFLVKLFEQEVPEIYDGLVEIRGVAREAGGRSKISVYSRDDRIDAVGACVGMKGSRVQSIVRELNGEKIDIVPWDEDLEAFVSRALAPAQISGLRIHSEEKSITVIVKEDQLSQAIGRDGQNVRLAAKLTGWKIDLVSAEEAEQRERLGEKLIMGIEEMAGVTDRLADLLREAGFSTVQQFVRASPEEIMNIPGIGPKTLEKLMANATETMKELDKVLEEWIAKERQERIEAKKKEEVTFDFDEESAGEGGSEKAVDPFADSASDEKSEEEPKEQPVLDPEADDLLRKDAAPQVSPFSDDEEIDQDVEPTGDIAEKPAGGEAASSLAVDESPEEVDSGTGVEDDVSDTDTAVATKEFEGSEEGEEDTSSRAGADQ